MKNVFLFILFSLASFFTVSCAGGAGEAVDAFTADGDYYNDGSGSGSGSGININLGGGGLGWVANTSYSGGSGGSGSSAVNAGKGGGSSNGSLTFSSMSTEEFVKLNTARSQIDEENYKGALKTLEELLKNFPDNQDAVELYRNLKRWLELQPLIKAKEEELSKLNAELESLLSKIERQRAVVEAAKKAMEDDFNAYNELSQQLKDKNAEVDEAYKELEKLRSEYEAETDPAKKAELKSKLDKAQSDYDKLVAERDVLKKLVDDAYQKYLASKAYYESALATLQQLIDEYNSKYNRKLELEKELRELKEEYETLTLFIKRIKWVASGLSDYSFSMRWIVDENTSAYSAYKDITRFIYTVDDFDDAQYAIVGKFGDYNFDSANYGIISFRYRKNPSNNAAIVSSLYATFNGNSTGYWDNTNVKVPQAIINSAGGTTYNCKYTTDMIEIIIYDMLGNILEQKQCPYNVYTCYGGSGTAFELFKSRVLSYEECYGSKFPVTDVTLFARMNRVKMPE